MFAKFQHNVQFLRKIIFNICPVKCVHISYLFLFSFLENIKWIKHENKEINNANYVTDTKHSEFLVIRDMIHTFSVMEPSSFDLFFTQGI